MNYLQDAHSFWNWIYFVVLIVIGSFFMMNLCLVVISAQFSVTKKRETERMIAELSLISDSDQVETNHRQGSCWEQTVDYFQQMLSRAWRKVTTCGRTRRTKQNPVS